MQPLIWILLLSVFGLHFGLVKSTCIYAQISIRFRANMVIISLISMLFVQYQSMKVLNMNTKHRFYHWSN